MSGAKDLARSISDRLTRLAKELKAPYPKVLTEFLLERLVVRLTANEELSNNLVFKGGYVSLRVYYSPRYTVDLDTLLKKGRPEALLEPVRKIVEAETGDGVWFRFEKTVDLETQGEYGGLRIVFRSGIGQVPKNLQIAQLIQLDIGVGDAVTPGPIQTETPYLLGGGKISWTVYPLETTASEKLHALITRGSASSRSKDIYDLCRFLPKCDPKILRQALLETFKSRGDTLPSDLIKHLKEIDTTALKKGWKSAIADIPQARAFDIEFEELIEMVGKIP